MSRHSTLRRCRAFSLLDLVVMLAAVASMVFVAYVMSRPRGGKAQRINCVSNLKQVGLSFRLWAGDNGDKYPMQVSTNAGGTMELAGLGAVFPHFMVMSNELATPRILICPEDRGRKATVTFASLRDANLSYWVVPEADESLPLLWLSGDRNLTTNSRALRPGTHWMTTNTIIGWGNGGHRHAGNLALSDGSVQQLSNLRLSESLTNSLQTLAAGSSNATFRILLP